MKAKIVSLLAATAMAASIGSAAASPGIVTDLTNLRAGPAVRFAPIAQLPAQSSVEVGRCMRGWCHVVSPAGSGFVAAALLAPLQASRYASAMPPAPTTGALVRPGMNQNAEGLLFVLGGLAGPAAFLFAAPSWQ